MELVPVMIAIRCPQALRVPWTGLHLEESLYDEMFSLDVEKLEKHIDRLWVMGAQ